MKKITHFLIALLLVIFLGQGRADTGATTTHGFIYKPPLAARGQTEKNLFDAGLDKVDARLGKEIWVGDPNYGTTFQTAITAIGSNAVILRVPTGTHNITADLTVPANVHIKPEKGAVFTIATSKTLTINGGLEAGLYQIFSCTGTGKVVFAQGAVKSVLPQWWGAKADGTTDSTTAIKAAVIAAQDQVLEVPPGRYRLTGAVNLLDGITGSVNIQGSSRAIKAPQTVFYIKEVTGLVFDKNTAVSTNPNGLYVGGIFFDGTNTGVNGNWSGGTTCDGVFKNTGGEFWNVHFENCSVQGLNKAGAVGIDFTNVYYSTLREIKVSGITSGWGLKYGGTYSTTNRWENVNVDGCQEGLLVIQGGAPLVYYGGCIESCTAGVVGSVANVIFVGTHFENIGYGPNSQTTGLSDQQIDMTLGSPFNVPVNTWFNFIDSQVVFDACEFFTVNTYSIAAYFRLINSGSTEHIAGSIEFRNCNGNDYYTKSAYPFFIKHYSDGQPECQIIMHAKGADFTLTNRADDLRKITFGELYTHMIPGNGWRLVTVKNKRWTFEPYLAAASYPVTSGIYPSEAFNPCSRWSIAGADFQAQGFHVGDEWIETHSGLGYPEKWVLVREQRTTTAAAITSASTAITLTDTPTATAGDIIRIVGSGGGLFVGTVLSINAGAKTIALADSDKVATTAGFDDTNTGLFVQTYKWAPIGQQGFRSGSGSPSGAVSPYFIGEQYLDTGGHWYKSTGLINTNWVALN